MEGYILRAYSDGKQRTRFTELTESGARARWSQLVKFLDTAYDRITWENWRDGKIVCAVYCV